MTTETNSVTKNNECIGEYRKVKIVSNGETIWAWQYKMQGEPNFHGLLVSEEDAKRVIVSGFKAQARTRSIQDLASAAGCTDIHAWEAVKTIAGAYGRDNSAFPSAAKKSAERMWMNTDFEFQPNNIFHTVLSETVGTYVAEQTAGSVR